MQRLTHLGDSMGVLSLRTCVELHGGPAHSSVCAILEGKAAITNCLPSRRRRGKMREAFTFSGTKERKRNLKRQIPIFFPTGVGDR